MDEYPPSALSIPWRTAADKTQDLHSIPLFQTPMIELFSIQDFQIQFHCYALDFDGKFAQ